MNLLGLSTLMMIVFKTVNAADCSNFKPECSCYRPSSGQSNKLTLHCDFDSETKVEGLINILSNIKNELVGLNIENLGFKRLPAGIFRNVTLTVLHISNSKIESIADEAFNGSENSLDHLVFDDLQISSMNANSLKNLKRLRTLEITENSNLKVISKAEIDLLSNLELKLLDFSNNKIENIEKNAFKSLAVPRINLSGNQLSELPKCFNKNSTKTIILDFNNFTKLPFEALIDVTKNLKVRLIANHIKTLKKEEMEELLRLGAYIVLHGNPLECGCDMKWIAELQQEKSKKAFAGECKGENNRKDMNIEFLQNKDFDKCK